jgi:hypothetical protein
VVDVAPIRADELPKTNSLISPFTPRAGHFCLQSVTGPIDIPLNMSYLVDVTNTIDPALGIPTRNCALIKRNGTRFSLTAHILDNDPTQCPTSPRDGDTYENPAAFPFAATGCVPVASGAGHTSPLGTSAAVAAFAVAAAAVAALGGRT